MTTTLPIQFTADARLADALRQPEPWGGLGPSVSVSSRARLALKAWAEQKWPAAASRIKDGRRQTAHLDEESYGHLHAAAEKWGVPHGAALRGILLGYLDLTPGAP